MYRKKYSKGFAANMGGKFSSKLCTTINHGIKKFCHVNKIYESAWYGNESLSNPISCYMSWDLNVNVISFYLNVHYSQMFVIFILLMLFSHNGLGERFARIMHDNVRGPFTKEHLSIELKLNSLASFVMDLRFLFIMDSKYDKTRPWIWSSNYN